MQLRANRLALGQPKQIALALGLALGITLSGVTSAQNTPEADALRSSVDTLFIEAEHAGISLPRDLPKYVAQWDQQNAQRGKASFLATRSVTTCADSGAGSLREAVSLANSGDLIDLSGINCNITLLSSITVPQASLTFKGGGSVLRAISGNNQVRIFDHTGTGGTLTIDRLTLRSGKVTLSNNLNAEGGCIRSEGNVVITNEARVKYCTAEKTNTSGTSSARGGAIFSKGQTTVNGGGLIQNNKAITQVGSALGGGIYAQDDVMLEGALVTRNEASTANPSALSARGGGIFTEDILSSKYSVVSNNKTFGSVNSAAGGAYVAQTANIRNSEFSGNSADSAAALLLANPSSGSSTSLITSTTIANNISNNSKKYGGAVSSQQSLVIRNSTISGNTEKNPDDVKYGAGLSVSPTTNLTISSSIIAGNMLEYADGGVIPSDMAVKDSSTPATITGTHNLFGFFEDGSFIVDPANHISISMTLNDLADNGGLTKTMSFSPSNTAYNNGLANSLATDQRGEGYPRVVGPQADIGAYELSSTLFSDGFE